MATKPLPAPQPGPIPFLAPLDVAYSIAPITRTSRVIDLGGSYAFGFTLHSKLNTDKVYALSAIALGQHDGWTAQILDPTIIAIPAQKEARVVVQVSATTKGDQVDPPRCEVVLSAVDTTQLNPINTQARLMLMALKEPPTPDPRVHVVLKDPGGINNIFASGVQPATLPVGFDIFTTVAGSYTVTAELREPGNWTIGPIQGSPFNALGGGATNFVAVPLKAALGAHETDLFLTVAGPGISAKFTMPVLPQK